MITLLSPSKTLIEKPGHSTDAFTIPDFAEKSQQLVQEMRSYSPSDLGKLMKISPKLSELNVERYLSWQLPFSTSNAARSLLMFKGEVFNGLKAETLSEKNLHFAQDHLRILSGLYGMLRPLDLMQPYRLEMGTNMRVGEYENLYEFWGDLLTDKLNEELENHREKVVVNLASDEYYKALNEDKLHARIVKCQFKEERDGKLKFITLFGKKARGLMARYIIENGIDRVDDIKTFDKEGYYFNVEHSHDDLWMFTR